MEIPDRVREGRDPTCCAETRNKLIEAAKSSHCKRYLEIGAGEGYTAAAIMEQTGAEIVAIEKDPVRATHARERLSQTGGTWSLLEGDAGEILPLLGGKFQLIFLDGPKAQYRRYLPDCKRLLERGGMLFSDDVLLYGWVRGEPPKRRRMLVEHIREYLRMLEDDPDFVTEYFEYGEGLAVSTKIK